MSPATILHKETHQKLIYFSPLSADRQREKAYFAHPQTLSVQKTSQYITWQSILPGETQ